MNTQSTTIQSSNCLKRLLGSLLVIIGLLKGLALLLSLAFPPSPSRILTAIGMYLQCLPLLLICIGVHLLTDMIELRVSSLLAVGLSPFVTWEHLGNGSWYWSVNSILCIFCSLYTLQHLFRFNSQLNQQPISSGVMPSWLPSRKQQSIIAAIGYWLFFLSVFAPFIVRLIDFISMFLHDNQFLLRTSEVWDMSDYNFNLIHNASLALTLCLAAMLYIIWTTSEYYVFRESTSKQEIVSVDAPSVSEDALPITVNAPPITEDALSITENHPPIS